MATNISSPPAEDAMSASKVLGNVDLLEEILRRVDSPSSLVRAALVSKRWLRTASGRDFLRRFCALHPPCRLLGFLVTGDCILRPEFVSMPALQPPDRELSAVLRRASNSVFDAFPEGSSRVWDCRDGRGLTVVYDFTDIVHGRRRFGVLDPLRHPDRGVVELPPSPPDWSDPEGLHAMLLPDDRNDDASCYRLRLHHRGPSARVTALVGVLRSGAWTVHCSAEAVLPTPPDRIPMLTVLAAGKLYMVAVAGYILGLDMATSSFFLVELPEGVAYQYYGNLVPCRGDGSVLYLLHLKGDQLRVWFRRIMDEHGAGGEWVLRDTISLHETCGHLVKQGFDPGARNTDVATIAGVGDNAEFVFLELHGSGVFVHTISAAERWRGCIRGTRTTLRLQMFIRSPWFGVPSSPQ